MLPNPALLMLAVVLVAALFVVARFFGKVPAIVLGSLAVSGVIGFAVSAIALS